MRKHPKKISSLLLTSLWLMRLGKRLARWSEGAGLAPRLFAFYLRERPAHGA